MNTSNLGSVPALDVLAIAPHPDDAEIGAGGTLALCAARGLRAGILDLTNGEPTPFGSPELRASEARAAAADLRVAWRGNLGLPNRSLEATLEARRMLAGVLRVARPSLLFCPYWEDAHADHVAACALAEAARFWAKLTRTDMPGEPHHPRRMLYYFSIHLRIHPQPAVVIDISDTIEQKMQSIGRYQSQFVIGRDLDFPTALDDIRDRARYWGWSIGRKFAEPFASREPIGLPGIEPLL